MDSYLPKKSSTRGPLVAIQNRSIVLNEAYGISFMLESMIKILFLFLIYTV